jgi:hypothetical protein
LNRIPEEVRVGYLCSSVTLSDSTEVSGRQRERDERRRQKERGEREDEEDGGE